MSLEGFLITSQRKLVKRKKNREKKTFHDNSHLSQKEPTALIQHVKCILVQALRLCTVRTVHRRSTGIALLFLDHGTRREWGVSVTHRPFFTPGKDPVPVLQEDGWALGPFWTGAENLASTGFRSSDRPSRSQSLHRLRYPAPSTACAKTLLYTE